MHGYPEGDLKTQVADPYHDVKAHAIDGTCAFAFAVQYLLRQGHTVEEIQRRDAEVYAKFNSYMRTQMDFLGVSGHVKFTGNDKPNVLAVQQVQQGRRVEVGIVALDDTITWLGDGVQASAWMKETEESEWGWFFMIFPHAFRTIAICGPFCFSFFAYANWKREPRSSGVNGRTRSSDANGQTRSSDANDV